MLDYKSILAKAEHYCAYSERCHYDVRQKLWEWQASELEAGNIMSELIENNFLNEERYATQYALGKFRINNWGKIKIKQGLKQHQINAKLITKALNGIDLDDYEKVLEKILIQKIQTLKGEKPLNIKVKALKFAQQRGFEWGEIEKKLKIILEV